MKKGRIYRWFIVLVLCGLGFSIYAQSFQVDTLQYAGDVNKHINVVILGDGYLEDELTQFRNDAKSFFDFFFVVKPFSNYRLYFNAFTISVPSNVSGAAMHPDSLIDNYFGSTFWYADIERLLYPTNYVNITSVLAENFPAYDQVVMLVNSTKYGGSGGWLATASLNEESKEIAMHELGHSFSDLADEYWAGEQYARERINMTKETNLDSLRWHNWYGDNEIGLYTHEESPNWYRPHQSCKMRYLGNPFCSVCNEATVERIYSLVSPLRDYDPNISNLSEPDDVQKFKLDLITPEPNTLRITWTLNDLVLDTNVDSILIDKTEFASGENLVVATIEDTSELIRPYAEESYHLTAVQWTISSTSTGRHNIVTHIVNQTISLYPNPLENVLNMKIQGKANDNITIELYDAQGKKLNIFSPEHPGVATLDLSDLNNGVYLVKIYVNNALIASRKIIKH